jgi:hypothetical protein
VNRIYLAIIATALIGKIAFGETTALQGQNIATPQELGKMYACQSIRNNEVADEFFRIFSTPIVQWSKTDKDFLKNNWYDVSMSSEVQDCVITGFIKTYNQLKSLCKREL